MTNRLSPEDAARWLPPEGDFRALAEFWAKYADGAEPSGPLAEEDDLGDSLQFRVLARIEERILRHYATSEIEMIIQLELLGESLASGGRSDNLDVLAVRNLQHTLAQSDDPDLVTWLRRYRREALHRPLSGMLLLAAQADWESSRP